MNRFTIFALLHDEKTSPTKRAAEIADAMAKTQADLAAALTRVAEQDRELGALRETLGWAANLADPLYSFGVSERLALGRKAREVLGLPALDASPQADRPRFVDPGRGPRQAVVASPQAAPPLKHPRCNAPGMGPFCSLFQSYNHECRERCLWRPQAAPPRHECPSCDLDDSVKAPPGKLLASTPIKRAATPVQGAPPEAPGSLWTTPANPGAVDIKVDESVTADDVRAAVESVQGRASAFSGARCEAWMAKGRCEFKPGHTGPHETRAGSYAWTTPPATQAAPADGPTLLPWRETKFWPEPDGLPCEMCGAGAEEPCDVSKHPGCRPAPAVPEPVREPNLGLALPLPKKPESRDCIHGLRNCDPCAWTAGYPDELLKTVRPWATPKSGTEPSR
jgi:hypothetical protein